MSNDSRRTQLKLDALWAAGDAGADHGVDKRTLGSAAGTLMSPRVGMFRPQLRIGDGVTDGTVIGTLEILGSTFAVLAPKSAIGVITAVAGQGRAQIAVDYRATLYDVDSNATRITATALSGDETKARAAAADASLRFVAPTSGRFYLRPAPGKPAFVAVGDVVSAGTTICLLEVMKTFHRVTFGGDGMPDRARVVEVVPAEESDVNAGDVLLMLAAD